MTTLAEKNDARSETNKVSERALMRTLAELGGARANEDDITFEGSKFVVPDGMSLSQAIKFLTRHREQQEEETEFLRQFNFRPLDGAFALQNALKKAFGVTGVGMATYTMFGKNPPQMRTVEIGVGETAQVPWGRLEFGPLEATLTLGATMHAEMGLLFVLSVTAPRKYKAHVEGLFKAVQNELETASIYRGKVINGAEEPAFIDPYVVDRTKVVYADEVYDQLQANIWSMLEHSDVMQDLGIPLKRSVLLGGPYGTGKSLAAMLTAQKAQENGWTFIQCRPGKDDLDTVMKTAQLYQPAVVFFEDVDTISQSGDPEQVSKLLDTFDGISAKGTRLLAVLTTNHEERIHKGMVRPGRLDAVIHIDALDRIGKEKLIKAVVDPTLLSDNIDFDAIHDVTADFLPAFLREAIDRAGRYMVARTNGGREKLTTADFVNAAKGLKPQLDLMNGATEGKQAPPVDAAMRNIIRDVISSGVKMKSATGDDIGRLYVMDPQDEENTEKSVAPVGRRK